MGQTGCEEAGDPDPRMGSCGGPQAWAMPTMVTPIRQGGWDSRW